jgi:hypothetical protein
MYINKKGKKKYQERERKFKGEYLLIRKKKEKRPRGERKK